MALKVRTFRLDDETWARWQARAAEGKTSVSGLIFASVEGAAAKDAEIAALTVRVVSLERDIGLRM